MWNIKRLLCVTLLLALVFFSQQPQANAGVSVGIGFGGWHHHGRVAIGGYVPLGDYYVTREYYGPYYPVTYYSYIVQPAPILAPSVIISNAASTNTQDEFTVNIPNAQGGYTAVNIRRSGAGFIGPQGEFYNEFPKVTQLQVMYGK
ncbi:MAG: hypothetical protein HQL16_04990 [Candidatus Omnitrophica bacterium]|nr:hypothetical protein [Candidatus Omnitrophota bacterium]